MSTRHILVTGAFGLLGSRIITRLIEQGFSVAAFDLPTRRNRRRASRLIPRDRGRVVWGDIRNTDDAARAVEGCDAVVHLAFVIPPVSEKKPDLAEAVNLRGSENLLAAAGSRNRLPAILFASSYTVHGDRREDDLIKPDAPLRPLNVYTRHKAAVEEMVRASGLRWCVMRFGAVIDIEFVMKGSYDPLIFEIPADAHHEMIDIDDAAAAVTNALGADPNNPDIWNTAHLIGGGAECRLRYADMINGYMEAMGIPPLRDEVFSVEALQGGCWMDTSDSQRLLDYQRVTFTDQCDVIRQALGFRRWIIGIFGPVIRMGLERMSPFDNRK